jgi:hypothetical protein
MPSPYEKATRMWPGVSPEDIIVIGPLGSRAVDNDLIYNRRTGQVQTGWVADKACFHGSLAEFKAAVEAQYGRPSDSPRWQRKGTEYRMVIALLEALPALEG